MVIQRKLKGRKVWIIDRRFRRPDGVHERYRRRAQVQTKEGAEMEEFRVVDHWVRHGTLETKSEPKAKKERILDPRWEDAVDYFRRHALKKRKPSTQRGYVVLLEGKHFGFWAKRLLKEVNGREVRRWIDALPNKPSTLRNYLIVLRAVLRSVGPDPETGEPGPYLSEMPRLPRLPTVGRTVVTTLTHEQVRALLGESRPKYCSHETVRRNQLPIALAAYAGLRASEVRGLKVKDIDLDRGVLTVRRGLIRLQEGTPKSGNEREVPITPRLRERLEERLHPGERKFGEPAPLVPTLESYVCVRNRRQEPFSDNGILAAFKRACGRCGIKGFRFHDLRHYFVTNSLSTEPGGAGLDIETVRVLAGHSDITTTSRYAHANMDRAKLAFAHAF